MPKRYIDADDLFSLIQDCVSAPYEESREVKDEVLEIIAEKKGCNVQEVVHCRDCKYYYGSVKYPVCCYHDYNVSANDFCSKGARKECDEK